MVEQNAEPTGWQFFQEVTDGGFDGGSYRDPYGRVFRSGDRIYRTIMPPAAEMFTQVAEHPYVSELIRENRLVGFRRLAEDEARKAYAGRGPEPALVVEHPRLPVISYPYEWSFQALKSAALHHLDLHLDLLAHDLNLIDATAYNVQFNGSRPIFIDTLSVRPYVSGALWNGHQQFCNQFLNPLLLRSVLGIPHNGWYRGAPDGIQTELLTKLLRPQQKLRWNMLMHVVMPARLQRYALALPQSVTSDTVRRRPLTKPAFTMMLRGLRRWIARLQPSDKGASIWGDYADRNSYASDETETKRRLVGDFAARVRPGIIVDLGCNTGNYSKVALERGAELAVGFDTDPVAIERAFLRATQENLNFLPLVLDLANPSPAQGWAGRERTIVAERIRPDALVALAVIHHLAIGRNVPLEEVVRVMVELAPNGLIEWVPKSDPTVQQMLALREDIFPNYNEEAFRSQLSQCAQIMHREVVSSTGRTIYEYSRRAAA